MIDIKKKAKERVLAYSWGKEVEFKTAFAVRHTADKMDEKGYPGYNLIRAGKLLDELRVAKHISEVFSSK